MRDEARRLKVGDVVQLRNGCRYGLVVGIDEIYGRYNLTLPQIIRYQVRFIDNNTGELMNCPDGRCRGQDVHCPICRGSYRAESLEKFSQRDIAFYRQEGMLR